MGLLDDYSGIGMSPRPTIKHQQIMAKLLIGLREKLYEDEYEVLTESVLNVKNLNSKAPDVVVYEKKTMTPIMFIEITNTKEVGSIINQTYVAIAEYKIQAAFVYNYEKKEWVSFGTEASGSEWEREEINLDDILD